MLGNVHAPFIFLVHFMHIYLYFILSGLKALQRGVKVLGDSVFKISGVIRDGSDGGGKVVPIVRSSWYKKS